nr:uncharacterized protein LOC109415886 [Aedes albopictus]
MNINLGGLFFVFMIYQPSTAVEKIHSCLPGSVKNICILDHVFYTRSQDIKHIFPQNYSIVHIGNDGWKKGINSVIQAFDGQLYAELGHPPVLEILTAEVEMLEIPRALSYANFAGNRIEAFWIEEGDAEPQLSYLDLGQNGLTRLTNITAFVNLETIYLQANQLEVLELYVFKNFTRLKVLNLNYNLFTVLSGDLFPPSLTYLGLEYNDMTTLDYGTLQLPSLKVLNIGQNSLRSIDAAQLLLGLPKLEVLRLSHNKLSHESLRSVLEVLRQCNVSYRDESAKVSCYYDSEQIEGVCMERQPTVRGRVKIVLLSILSMLIASLFVLLMYWVYVFMNK